MPDLDQIQSIVSGLPAAPPPQAGATAAPAPAPADEDDVDRIARIGGQGAQGTLPATPENTAYPVNPGDVTGYTPNIAKGVLQGSAGTMNTIAQPSGTLARPFATSLVFIHDALAPYLGYQRFPDDVRNALLNDVTPQAGDKIINTIGQKIGTTPLDKIKPANAGEAYAGLAAQGATGAAQAAPLFGATAAALPVTAASGAAGAMGGHTLAEMAPEWAKPYVEQLGNWIFGMGTAAGLSGAQGLLRGGSNVSADLAARTGLGPRITLAPPGAADEPFVDIRQAHIDPDTGQITGPPLRVTAGQAAAAGKQIAAGAGETPSTALANVPDQPAGVPGQATMGQLRGNQLLLSFERGAKTRNPVPFQNTEAQNAVLRMLALGGIGGSEDVRSAASDFVQRRLAEINAQTPAEQQARAVSGALVNIPDQSAEQSGEQMRTHIAQAQAPAIGQSEQALATVQQQMQTGLQGIGGGPETDVQQIGATTRNALATLDQEKNAQVERLFDQIGPGANVDMSPVIRAGKSINRQFDLRPNLEAPDADVQGLIDKAANQKGVVPFQDLRDLRSALTTRLATATRNGETAHKAWLSQLVEATHQAMAETAGNKAVDDAAAVASGQMSPDQQIGPRLAAAAHTEPAPATVPKVPDVAFTPAGRQIGVRYGVVDGRTLITSHNDDLTPNPKFPKELQPRERGRKASEFQINKIAQSLQPQRVGGSSSVMDGAPIVGPDMVVEHGNGRTIGIRRALAANGKEASAYRDFLRAQGFEVGPHDMLVRFRTTDMTPAERVRSVEEGAGEQALALSATERAAIDAKRLNDNVLNLYNGGDVGAPQNTAFQRAFVRNVLEPGQEGAFATKEGELTVQGRERMRNALLHKAYGDPELVEQLAEHGDENMKAYGTALTNAAPAMARLAQDIEAGRVDPAVGVGQHLVEAGKIVKQARAQRTSIGNLIAQQDLVGGVSPHAEQILRWAYGADLRGRLNSGKLGDGLQRYAELARQQLAGPRLFDQNLPAADLLREAQRHAETVYAKQASAGASGSGGPANIVAGYGARGPEARGPGAGPVGPGGTEGGADATAARGSGAAQSRGVIEGPPLTPNLTEDQIAAYAEGRTEHQQRMATYHEGPLGDVLAPGRSKGSFATDASRLPAMIFRSGGGSPEAIQQFQQMLGGATDAQALDAFGKINPDNVPAMMAARQQALNAMQRYASFSLRTAAVRNGELVPNLARNWMQDHRAALDAFPALRDQFENLAKVGDRLADVQGDRKAMDADYPLANAKTNADLTARYVQSGPRGSEMVQQYQRDSGGGPQAMQTLDNAIASDLRSKAFQGGEWSKAAYDRWMDQHRSLLSQRPELAKMLGTMRDAQNTLADAAEERAYQVKQLQNSAMGHYLTKDGDPVEPQSAIKSLFDSPTSVQDARDLVHAMRRDPTALAGLRRNVYDWFMQRITSSAEAGTTGVPEIKPAALIKQLMGNQKIADTLHEVFEPEQMQVLQGVAQSMLYEQMGRNATSIKGSPGTAADVHALGPHEPSGWFQAFIGDHIGHWFATALHAHPMMGAVVRSAAAFVGFLHAQMRQAGMKTINDLAAAGVNDPKLGRVLLQHAITDPKSPILKTLAQRMAAVYAAGAAGTGR